MPKNYIYASYFPASRKKALNIIMLLITIIYTALQKMLLCFTSNAHDSQCVKAQKILNRFLKNEQINTLHKNTKNRIATPLRL